MNERWFDEPQSHIAFVELVISPVSFANRTVLFIFSHDCHQQRPNLLSLESV